MLEIAEQILRMLIKPEGERIFAWWNCRRFTRGRCAGEWADLVDGGVSSSEGDGQVALVFGSLRSMALNERLLA